MHIASGKRVSLRRATLADRERAYRWLARSDATPKLMGPPFFSDRPVPDYERFCERFAPHLFDGTRPFDGRAFVLCNGDGTEVGCIAHGQVDLLNDVVEIEIWLAHAGLCGRGYGSEALTLLTDWLQESCGVNRFLLRPSRRNVRALRAIRRAGFRETDLPAAEVVRKLGLAPGDYGDEVLQFRVLPLPRQTLALEDDRTYAFVDSEFTSLIEPRLISVGAVATDATAFYCELGSWPPEHCSPFVRTHVLPLLDGNVVPHPLAAEAFAAWLAQRAQDAPLTLISDSGFDRWAIADLLGSEDLPAGVEWRRVPVAYEAIDAMAIQLGLRRHHALDDARALRHLLLDPADAAL